jgi:hypothetical protein
MLIVLKRAWKRNRETTTLLQESEPKNLEYISPVGRMEPRALFELGRQ